MNRRLESLRIELNNKELDAILITSATNRRYLTGFTGSAGNVLVTHNRAILITDFRYTDQAVMETSLYEIIIHKGVISEKIAELLTENNIKSLGFEEEYVTYQEYRGYLDTFVGTKLVATNSIVEKLRIIKDENELILIKKAIEIAEEAFTQLLPEIKAGVSEKELARNLEDYMRRLGAEGASFPIIIASGKRSALPHGNASDKLLDYGDLVTFDFGAKYQGYISDITRTLAIGEVDEQQQEIYEIVLEAQLNALANIKPGMTGIDADLFTRDVITGYGYGENYGHGTGHGIGLDVHEAPTVSARGKETLKPGMVITIEPGIYLAAVGGVRIEDDVLVTDTGLEILTKLPKELLIL